MFVSTITTITTLSAAADDHGDGVPRLLAPGDGQAVRGQPHRLRPHQGHSGGRRTPSEVTYLNKYLGRQTFSINIVLPQKLHDSRGSAMSPLSYH